MRVSLYNFENKQIIINGNITDPYPVNNEP